MWGTRSFRGVPTVKKGFAGRKATTTHRRALGTYLEAHAHSVPRNPLGVGDENLAKIVPKGGAQRGHFCACASAVARIRKSLMAHVQQARGQLAAADAVERFNVTE